MNIVPFEFQGVPVRTAMIDGVAHLLGKDVAERLGYADPTNAMKQHCRGVVKRHPIANPAPTWHQGPTLSSLLRALPLSAGSKGYQHY